MPKPCKSCMGRKVEYSSPAKHPEQDDPLASVLEKADKGQTSSTYSGSRKDMMPAQSESPKPAKQLNEYLKRVFK